MPEYRASTVGHDAQVREFPDTKAAVDWANSLLGPSRLTVLLDKRVTDDPTVYPWENVGQFDRASKARLRSSGPHDSSRCRKETSSLGIAHLLPRKARATTLSEAPYHVVEGDGRLAAAVTRERRSRVPARRSSLVCDKRERPESLAKPIATATSSRSAVPVCFEVSDVSLPRMT